MVDERSSGVSLSTAPFCDEPALARADPGKPLG